MPLNFDVDTKSKKKYKLNFDIEPTEEVSPFLPFKKHPELTEHPYTKAVLSTGAA